MSSNHAQMSQALFSLLLKESAALVTDADLHLAHLRQARTTTKSEEQKWLSLVYYSLLFFLAHFFSRSTFAGLSRPGLVWSAPLVFCRFDYCLLCDSGTPFVLSKIFDCRPVCLLVAWRM